MFRITAPAPDAASGIANSGNLTTCSDLALATAFSESDLASDCPTSSLIPEITPTAAPARFKAIPAGIPITELSSVKPAVSKAPAAIVSIFESLSAGLSP